MKLSGEWKSKIYANIFGTFEVIIDDLMLVNIPISKSDFQAKLTLYYSPNSLFKYGQSINIALEGVYNHEKDHRLLLRQEKFNCEQYFTLTLNSADKENWKGWLTCVFPVDCVQMDKIDYSEIKNEKDIKINDEESHVQDEHITIAL